MSYKEQTSEPDPFTKEMNLLVVILVALIWAMVLVVWTGGGEDSHKKNGGVGFGSGLYTDDLTDDPGSDPPFDDGDDVGQPATVSVDGVEDQTETATETVQNDNSNDEPSCAFDARDGELRTCYTLEGGAYLPTARVLSHTYRFDRERCAWDPSDDTIATPPYPAFCETEKRDVNAYACARGVTWTLEPTETFDEITKTYTRPMRFATNTRAKSDPNYCDDTNEASVCAQWRKTCLGNAPGVPDEVKIGRSHPTRLHTCVIENCRTPAADCTGDYGAWSACDRACGPDGKRYAPKCGSESDRRQDRVEACNAHACPPGCSGDPTQITSAPSACSRSCGSGGTQTYHVCATGATVSRACNTHACAQGCDGTETADGWGQWVVVDGTKSEIEGTTYVESRTLCSDPGGFVQTTTRFVPGFNTDGIQLRTESDRFVLQLKGAHFERTPTFPSAGSRYRITLQVALESEGRDGWHPIHRIELSTDTLGPERTFETTVAFADIADPRYISEIRTYRAHIAFIDGSTNGVLYERYTSYEIQIPLGQLTPVHCVGDWGSCLDGVKAYQIRQWPRYGGASCDYQDQQRASCVGGATRSSDDVIRFDCGYHMAWMDFGDLLRNVYRVTEWDDRYGQILLDGIVRMPIMFGMFTYGERVGNVLRPFDRSLTHVYHQPPTLLEKPWEEEWRLDGELLQHPYQRSVIYFETTDATPPYNTERCCIRTRDANNTDDWFLRLDSSNEFVFKGNRAFRVTWTPRSEISNGPYADEACWFYKRSSSRILNDHGTTTTRTVCQWFTYIGGLVVGLNPIGRTNQEMFAAYQGDTALGLAMVFTPSNAAAACGGGGGDISDGNERCVMTLWSHAGNVCDPSTCTIEQTRQRERGSIDCPTERTRKVACTDVGMECPCVATAWVDAPDLSGECDLSTCQKRQTRTVNLRDCASTEQTVPCGRDGDWSAWQCDCATQKEKTTRTICRNGVKTVEEQSRDCSVEKLTDQCCELKEWTPWGYMPDRGGPHVEGACSKPCGGGMQYSYRSVINKMSDTLQNIRMCEDRFMNAPKSKGRTCNDTPCEHAVEYACDLYNTPEGNLQSAYIRDAGLGIAYNDQMLRSVDRSTLQSQEGLRFNQIPDITDHGLFLLQDATNTNQCLVSQGNMYDPAKGALAWKTCSEVKGKRDWYANWKRNGNVLENGAGGFLKPYDKRTWIVSNHNKPGNMPANQITNWDDGRLYDCYAFETSDASAAWKANPSFGEEQHNQHQHQTN